MIEQLIEDCKQLKAIPEEAAELYASAAERLQNHVNDQFEANPKLNELIGGNPLDVMRNNHRNHAAFMATVFKLNSFELLARTVPWVYRAYHSRGFSYDYFMTELVAWQVAIHECLDRNVEIRAVYTWMVQHHSEMIQLSLSGEGLSFSVHREANEMQQIFLSLLLHGDSRGCLKLVEQSIKTPDEMKHFYLDVVWPAMVTIGSMWESNRISVAEEHLATAIVGRVMAALYSTIDMSPVTRGKAIVTAGPNEFHEVGARMIADFMEMDGWDVTYLGANTPALEVVKHVRREKPAIIALSVATVFNMENARRLIRLIRDDEEIENTKIMVGGVAFGQIPDLYEGLGADGCASDAENAVRLAADWWRERSAHVS